MLGEQRNKYTLKLKLTTKQAQNLAKGRDGPGQPVKIWDGTIF